MTAETASVDLLRRLIRFDTSNPPGNERACIEFVGEHLERAGISPRYVALRSERPNLVARVPGRGEAPPMLLYGHVDVVPADPRAWSHPPFAAELVDGEVWGRGALDMKGGVAMLVATLTRLASGESPPPGDVILALTVDEEAGSAPGMKFLVEEHSELFAGARHALSEGGGFTQWHRDVRLVPISVAEKQRCLIRATVRGQSGHAAAGVGRSASAKLGQLLSRLASRRLPVHVTPVVRSMFGAMTASLPAYERIASRALLTPRLTDGALKVLGADGELLAPFFHNTATPTSVRGGTGTNVVPGEFTVDIDGRALPGTTPIQLVAEVETLAGELASFELVHEEPAVPSQPSLELLPMLADVARESDPGCVPIPVVLPGYTDARYVSKLGIQTYGFLPMRLPRHITMASIHGADERVPADAVDFGVRWVTEVVNRYRG